MQLVWFGSSGDVPPKEGSYEESTFFPPDRQERVCAYRVSTDFKVVDGRRMPLWLELESVVTMDDLKKEPWEPTWAARVELRNGAPRIVNLAFDSEEREREVKSSDFQRVRSAVYVYYAAFCAELGPDGEPVYRIDDPDADKRIRDFLERRRTGRQRLKTADYKRAAQVYRDNFRDTPTRAVAEAFGVGIRQGGNIVAECRRRGFLPATKQGRKQA